METITFNCRFITPAFLGGADPRGTPELRAPSVKGALRWWWRAQCGIADLKEMKKKEFEVFGGVEGNQASKSSFSIRTIYDDLQPGQELPRSMTAVRNKTFKVNIFEYLAFGIYEQKEKKLNRDFVKPGEKFQVKFNFSNSEHKNEVLSAFRLLAIFSGIGTKTRNGFGKFEILQDPTPLSWKTALKKLKTGNEKGFTSFSENLCCFQTNDTSESIEQAWGEIGKAYKNAREFIDDPHYYTHRSYIASPIVDNKRQKSFLDRHAKPYFLTTVPENGEFRGIILFLPYLFLEGASTMMKELLNEKSKNPNSTGIRIVDLKTLLQTPIPKHQEYFKESNGFFHKELCHDDNPNALTQVTL